MRAGGDVMTLLSLVRGANKCKYHEHPLSPRWWEAGRIKHVYRMMETYPFWPSGSKYNLVDEDDD